jgi:serine phosphatase RsbU (regulator of sigma subunit)
MLYTDGLYEVEGPSGEFFDQARLRKVVEQRLRQPAEQLFEEVVTEVQRFCPQVGFVDDVCLVGIEVQQVGDGAAARRTEALSGNETFSVGKLAK